jgi:hypothetical protein
MAQGRPKCAKGKKGSDVARLAFLTSHAARSACMEGRRLQARVPGVLSLFSDFSYFSFRFGFNFIPPFSWLLGALSLLWNVYYFLLFPIGVRRGCGQQVGILREGRGGERSNIYLSMRAYVCACNLGHALLCLGIHFFCTKYNALLKTMWGPPLRNPLGAPILLLE